MALLPAAAAASLPGRLSAERPARGRPRRRAGPLRAPKAEEKFVRVAREASVTTFGSARSRPQATRGDDLVRASVASSIPCTPAGALAGRALALAIITVSMATFSGGLRARFGPQASPDVASRTPADRCAPSCGLARFEPAIGRPRRPPQAKTTMTLKSDDKQHDAYRKKKAAQYKEPRALTEDELAEAQAREIAEKRAAKAHVPLAAINRGDFQEGVRRPRRKF